MGVAFFFFLMREETHCDYWQGHERLEVSLNTSAEIRMINRFVLDYIPAIWSKVYWSFLHPWPPPHPQPSTHNYSQVAESRTLEGMVEVNTKVGLILWLQVLLRAVLIKCCKRQSEQIWSLPLSARLIRVANRVEHLYDNLLEGKMT